MHAMNYCNGEARVYWHLFGRRVVISSCSGQLNSLKTENGEREPMWVSSKVTEFNDQHYGICKAHQTTYIFVESRNNCTKTAEVKI